MYNVERYLPEFLASLERQTYGIEQLQIVLVDDGSTDETLRLAEAFRKRHPENVIVISKANGGQASARNVGLAAATAEWLTFPDPDDVLSDGYFREVADVVSRARVPELAVVSTRILLWYEADDEVRDTHALSARFHHGLVIKDLDQDPEWIQPHVTSGFVRADVVRDEGLAFPEELRLRFEDGNFISRYLLHCARPVIAFVPTAEYLYRQRADSSSTIQSSFSNPKKYTDTIRYGFMGVVAEADRLGRLLPRWTQNLFLYDQFWILRSSQTNAVRQATYPPEMYDELAELIPMYLRHVTEEAIEEFSVMPVVPWMREALLLSKRGGGHTAIYRTNRDRRRGLVALMYRYGGAAPLERLFVGDRPIEARYTKTQELEYVGKPVLWQRTLWVPDDCEVDLELDGVRQDAPLDHPLVPSSAYATGRGAGGYEKSWQRVIDAVRRRLTGQFWSLLRRDLSVRSQTLAARFRDAWVFIDRDVDANDSAEDMYWWVRQNHPDINSWFVVRKSSADWRRMKARGARLVAYASPEFYALLVHAKHLASSHADRFVTNALPRKLTPPAYAFTFLQHGVIKGDLSLWLNPKNIDVFVTSTEDEYRYITEVSPYRFGRKETRLTGLPRFDVLKERRDGVPLDERNIILLMPTWRNYLVGAMAGASNERSTVKGFDESLYAHGINDLLASKELTEIARVHDMRVIFMPHPNMRHYLDRLRVSPGVEMVSYDDADVREILARAAVLLTDYSSTAFNAAYLDIPVVYYQFDQQDYFSSHTERVGYFDYYADGFGPVTTTARHAVQAVADALDGTVDSKYAARVERAFPVRDGGNRGRVFEAMCEATTVRPLREREQRAVDDGWLRNDI